MTAVQRLVVGTDGSDSAWRAVDHAVRLARRIGAEVVVANAFPASGTARAEVSDVEAGRDVGASILRDVSASFGIDAVRCVLREGDPTEQLIALAREEGADAIVVGNRGMGRRGVLGAVPARVAHRAPCSVLIVHTTGGEPAEPYRRVLIGTDGSPTAARALAEGAELAGRVGAEVFLIHAGDPARGRDVLRTAVDDLPGQPSTAAVEGEPAAAIIEMARTERCDLIVIGNKGMTGARRFLASVPSRVAHHAPTNVLLVKTT